MRLVATVRLAAALLLVALAAPALPGSTAALAATQSQEYAAVQALVGPQAQARRLLSPALHATGTDALADAAALGLAGAGFAAVQRHPAQMMDAIQRYFRQFKGTVDAVSSVESINAQFGFLDLSGLSAQAQAAVISHILTRPPASTYLRAIVARAVRPTCQLPRGSRVAQVFCPVVAFPPSNGVPLYLPSWFPASKSALYAYVVANNHQLWIIQLSANSSCGDPSCATWYIQGIRGAATRPGWDAVVDLGANGKGYLYLNRGSNSPPNVEWTRGGNTYNALGLDRSPSQAALLRVLRSLVRVSD
jgi:hypothetical protein